MELSKRLRKLIEYQGITQAEFAKIIGSDRRRVENLVNDVAKKLKEHELESLASIGISRDWLLTGEGEMFGEGAHKQADHQDSTTVQVPYFNHIRVSAGLGIEVFDETPDGIYEVSAELLKRGKNVQCIKVSGYSMTPRFDDGDFLFVDIAEREIRAEGIYVISVDNALLVKTVQWMPDGLRLISENKEFETVFLSAETCEAKQVQIIGRVVGAFTYC